jgi:hypothetical protein
VSSSQQPETGTPPATPGAAAAERRDYLLMVFTWSSVRLVNHSARMMILGIIGVASKIAGSVGPLLFGVVCDLGDIRTAVLVWAGCRCSRS